MLLLATTASQAQFVCTTNNGTVAIMDYAGPGGAVTVPATTDNLPVTGIANEAFYDRPDITSVVIPDSVTNFGAYAFYDCGGLTNITMPAGLVTIGDYAFAGCSGVTNIVLPAGVTSIGNGTFSGCSTLSSITLSSNLTNIGATEFLNCINLTNINIPAGVTSIGNYAFSGCINLAAVTIPNGVTNINYGAFFKCASLGGVTIPNSVASIGQYAFYDCTSLATVRFNGQMPSADFTVFSGDTAQAYYLPGALGWGPTIGGISTAIWTLPNPVILNNDGLFGLQNNQFGFTVAWATNVPVVVETCTDLASWQPVQTNTTVNGLFYFADLQWSNYPGRFYRVSPVSQ